MYFAQGEADRVQVIGKPTALCLSVNKKMLVTAASRDPRIFTTSTEIVNKFMPLVSSAKNFTILAT
jgi:hypothetical protein